MAVNNAVRRLHNDLQELRHAEAQHASDAKSLRQDQREIAKDRKELKSDKKQGDQMHRTLDADRKGLTRDVANEQKALAAIDAQRQAALTQYQADGFVDPIETAALAAIDQQRAATASSFDTKIAGDRTNISQVRSDILAKRAENARDRTAINHDGKAIKRDNNALARDHQHIHNDRRKALKDLTPAEYHMGLKDTNRVRRELGLRAVKHVIRPDAGLTKVADLAKRYLGRYESDLQRSGVTLPCPTSESCANFVSSMLSKTGATNFRTLGVDDLNNRLRARGWHEVSLRDAKPGDVWICDGAHGEQHTEIVASNNNGHVTLIGSNNHPVPGNQQINYDGSSAYISGSFILAPR